MSGTSSRRIAILMPAFQERGLTATLGVLRSRAAELGSVCVFLVDDGGDPPVVAGDLPHAISTFSIVLARHVINLGQGASLETARCLALDHAARHGPFHAFVTMDADGQHRVEDVIKLVEAIDGGADVVLGNRFMGGSTVPRARALLLHAARWFEAVLIGRRLGDAHNGLRAFRGHVVERLALRQNRMAHATELVGQVHSLAGARIVEVPVAIQYTPASLAKGQRASGAIAIAIDLFHRYLFGAAER